MKSIPTHRIELAKQRFREKITFEFVKTLPAYKHITRIQFEELRENIEALCLNILESLTKTNNDE